MGINFLPFGKWSRPENDGIFEKWKSKMQMNKARMRFTVNTTELEVKREDKSLNYTSSFRTAAPGSGNGIV